jgi:tetratricopeptide (TPR) repeat protein
VHRDIKPSDLLLDERGNLVVADFGLARMQRESRSSTGDVAVLLSAVVLLAASVFVMNRALCERSDALARSERNLALALALDTVNATYVQVGKEWLSKNGDLTQVQRGILDRSLKTCQAIVKQADDRPASQVQVGRAYRRIARINQGLRDIDAARACYDRAAQVQSTLVALDPDNDDYRQELSATYSDYGILLRTAREWPEAEQAYDRCQQELARVAAHKPDDLEIANALIVCAINRAALWSDQGRHAEAEKLLADARTATDRLSRSDKPQFRLPWLASSGLLASLIEARVERPKLSRSAWKPLRHAPS